MKALNPKNIQMAYEQKIKVYLGFMFRWIISMFLLKNIKISWLCLKFNFNFIIPSQEQELLQISSIINVNHLIFYITNNENSHTKTDNHIQ